MDPRLRERRARQALIALAVLASVAAVSATGSYSYPETLAAIRGELVFVHDVSGDLAIVVSGAYLYLHLLRTWRVRRQRLSRYSGLVLVAIWSVAALSGVYGQLRPLEQGGVPWLVHTTTSVAIVVLGCFHGAWGFRPRRRID